MTGMLDLGLVLQLVVNGFNDVPFTQQQFIQQRQQAVLHPGSQAGDELQSLLPHLLEQGLGNVAFVAEQLAKQPSCQFGYRFAIIDIPRCEREGQHLPDLTDDQMELEAIEPTERTLPPCRQALEDFVSRDPSIGADPQGRGIDKGDTRAATTARLSIGPQPQDDPGQQLNEASVADQMRKLTPQMDLDVVGVVGLESAIASLMEMDQDRHDFTLTQPRLAHVPSDLSGQLSCLLALEGLAEIIDSAEQFQ